MLYGSEIWSETIDVKKQIGTIGVITAEAQVMWKFAQGLYLLPQVRLVTLYRDTECEFHLYRYRERLHSVSRWHIVQCPSQPYLWQQAFPYPIEVFQSHTIFDLSLLNRPNGGMTKDCIAIFVSSTQVELITAFDCIDLILVDTWFIHVLGIFYSATKFLILSHDLHL